jgi:DNA-binding HxlR family transcriptional regulator
VRSYHQYCSVARALDVVGERWTLLIVRELMTRGACRYTDLRAGLPGIATNLLAARLRELEAAGIVEREEAPPPIATTLFRLTPRGLALRPVLEALGRWGAPLMREADEDAFRAQWLKLPVRMFLSDSSPGEPPATIQIRAGSESAVIEVADGTVTTRLGTEPSPDASLAGPPQLVMAVLSGRMSIEAAEKQGLRREGSPSVPARVLPSGKAGVMADLAVDDGREDLQAGDAVAADRGGI